MERSLKRLLRIYPIARNWMALPNYMMPLQSLQNISQMYSTNSTDYTQLKDVTVSLTGRKVYNNVKITQEPLKLLEIAATNYTNMSLHDAINSLSTLFRVSKNIKNTNRIEKHIGFVRLCEVLNRDVRLMKIRDVIETLKILVYFQTQSNSFLIQSLLQMIRASVNEMSLQDIVFVVFLLKKMNITPLRDALLIALPLVFEIQLPTKLDPDDLSLLIWSLRFITEQNIQNPDIHDRIFKSLLKHENTLDVQKAKLIFYNLCNMSELSPIAHKMLCNIQDILISKAKELNEDDVINILEKLGYAAQNKENGTMFYTEILVDALVNSALYSSVNFTRGITALQVLNNLNHVHIPLLEYLAGRCFERPKLLKDLTCHKIYIILEGFINADYKPVFWDTIKDIMLENIETEEIPNKLYIRLVLYLIALDCYNPHLLKKSFSINIKSNDPKKDIYAREILLLYQSVKTMYSTYAGPWPQESLLEYANTIKLTPPAYSFKPALERALGGPQYVHNDLKTKLGHHIDHVVVMRKGGYPIAINTDIDTTKISYVEDIQTPIESQMIFIFNLPDSAYSVNSQRLKSTWALKLRSAEALTKSNTIGINSTSWMKLPEHERVPYLMQAIKLKCEDLLVSIN